MRVAHVITRLIVGGAQENTIASVLGLREKPGVEVSLISGPTTGPEGSLEPRVANIPGLLTIVPELVRPVSPWHDWLALRKLTRLFRETRPDIVHTHSGKAGVLGRLAAHAAGVPIIVHTIHGPSFGPFQGSLANFAFRAAERRAGRVTTHFVSVANAMTEQYFAAGIGRPDQYIRIFSGFDLEPFLNAKNDPALRAKLGIAPDDFVIGKVARFFENKGHDDLFAIAPTLALTYPHLKFLLVGDGNLRPRFERLAQQYLPGQCIFTGLVPPGEVPALIGIMDVLVHLSRREGLARTLPQALAAGKPVIAYDCDGAREMCRDGETGFLLKAGDTQRLMDRLEQLAFDSRLRECFGTRGRELVKDCFPVQRMVDDLHALYLRLQANRTK
ncbi:MAG: group 1 glycosyl transferase [Limisphaerales bacterium]|nr:MAG: group 1 glycosyl transferase [Limisphaerales bacterium]TXT45901.1 MAG: group 1 glycosyl transferase [Limisphaerales bacterium]